MSGLLLVVAAVLWALAVRLKDARLDLGAVGTHAVAALGLLATRGAYGWAPALVTATLLPGALAVTLWRDGPVRGALRLPSAALGAAIALWSLTHPGAATLAFTAWTVPHVVLSILGLGAAAGAALLAVARLRGRALGLLVAAAVVTALPLASERAREVVVKGEDGATVAVTVHAGEGDPGAMRTVPARLALPLESPLRALAVALVLAALGMTLFRRAAGLTARFAWVEKAMLAALAAHALLLASALLPRTIGDDSAAVAKAAEATVTPETAGDEYAEATGLPTPPYRGGPSSPAAPLPLALLGLALALAAVAKPPETPEPLERAEGRLAGGALGLLAAAMVTGLVWSNFAWGGPALADPKLYATGVALGLYGLYFYVQAELPHAPRAPSWIALLAFAVLLLSLLGPDLGLTAPTLHHFGA